MASYTDAVPRKQKEPPNDLPELQIRHARALPERLHMRRERAVRVERHEHAERCWNTKELIGVDNAEPSAQY